MCLSVGSSATEVTVAWWVSWRPTCENCDGEEFHDFFLGQPGLTLVMVIRWRKTKPGSSPGSLRWRSLTWMIKNTEPGSSPGSPRQSLQRALQVLPWNHVGAQNTFHQRQKISSWASFTSSPVARNWPLGERETQDIRWRWPRASFWAPSKDGSASMHCKWRTCEDKS